VYWRRSEDARRTVIGTPAGARLCNQEWTGNVQAVEWTYVITVTNTFTDAKPVRISIIFAGKLEQTARSTSGGLDCLVGHDAGINAAVNCTGPIPQGATTSWYKARLGARRRPVTSETGQRHKQQNVTIT